jgi:Rieske Fe-S protein
MSRHTSRRDGSTGQPSGTARTPSAAPESTVDAVPSRTAAPTARTRTWPGRRAILLGMGGASAAAALAGCGSHPAETAGSNNAQGFTGGSVAGRFASKDLGKTSAIPVGGGKVFPDQIVVVTQPKSGQFKAFSATCTHMGCTVTQVKGGVIICPCHGSRYSISDGSVQGGPAPAPLPSRKITIRNGEIFLV